MSADATSDDDLSSLDSLENENVESGRRITPSSSCNDNAAAVFDVSGTVDLEFVDASEECSVETSTESKQIGQTNGQLKNNQYHQIAFLDEEARKMVAESTSSPFRPTISRESQADSILHVLRSILLKQRKCELKLMKFLRRDNQEIANDDENLTPTIDANIDGYVNLFESSCSRIMASLNADDWSDVLDQEDERSETSVAKIKSLIAEVADLRGREAKLIEEVAILNRIVEDFQTSSLVNETAASSSPEFDDASSMSPRSDRSISSHLNAVGLQYSLDVFAENNKLLREKETCRKRSTENVKCMRAKVKILEAALNEAEEKYKGLMNECSTKEANFETRIKQLEKELTELKKTFEISIATNEESRRALIENIKRLEEERRGRSEGGENVEEIIWLKGEIGKLQAKLVDCGNENEKLKIELDLEKSTSSGLRMELDADRAVWSKRASNAENESKRQLENLKTLAMEKVDLENDILKLQLNNKRLVGELDSLHKEYNELLQHKSSWQAKYDELKTIRLTQDDFASECDRLRLEVEKLNMQLKVSNDKYNDLNVDLAKANSNLAFKSEELQHLKKVVNEKYKESFKEKFDQLSKKYDDALSENEKIMSELDHVKVKLEKNKDMERAFDAQNLGLDAMKRGLESKDSTLNEFRSRIKDLEQILDENLREKEQKSSTIMRLQEQMETKCKSFVDLQQEFDSWKMNANAQFEDTVRKYEEKLKDLYVLLEKYVGYPGKLDKVDAQTTNAEKSTQVSIACDRCVARDRKRSASRSTQTFTFKCSDCESGLGKIEELNEIIARLKRNCGQCDARESEIEKLTADNRNLARRCEQSDVLHEQATKTIEALRCCHDEEIEHRKYLGNENDRLTLELERIRRDNIDVVSDAGVASFAYEILGVRMQNFGADLSQLSISGRMEDERENFHQRLANEAHEKCYNWQVKYFRTENHRRQLVGQKRYLESQLEKFQATERDALSIVNASGFPTPPSSVSHDLSPLLRFRGVAFVVIASIRLRNRIRRYPPSTPSNPSPYLL